MALLDRAVVSLLIAVSGFNEVAPWWGESKSEAAVGSKRAKEVVTICDLRVAGKPECEAAIWLT